MVYSKDAGEITLENTIRGSFTRNWFAMTYCNAILLQWQITQGYGLHLPMAKYVQGDSDTYFSVVIDKCYCPDKFGDKTAISE